MPKSLKIISALILIVVLTGALANCASLGYSAGTVTIAVVEENPIYENGEINPQSAYAGTQLAVEQINKQGGVGGVKIVVELYSDENDPNSAKELAAKIAQSSAIAVIGHSSVETSKSAAAIYEENGIPVIGVIPASDELNESHPHYFTISYSAEQEAAYLANYVIKVLDKDKAGDDKSRNKVSIIYTSDEYGKILKDQFTNTFHGLGGTIITSRIVQKDEASIEKMAGEIAALNSETENPGSIFIATDEKTAANLVIKMRRKGLNYPIVGASNMSGAAFQQEINGQSEEKAQSGYFTSGIMATRQIMFDCANEQAGLFRDEFQSTYENVEPSDLTTNGYDAALTLFAAIQKADLNRTDVKSDRDSLYNSLLGMDGPQTSAQGLAGRIYFDPARKAVRATRFGVYQNGQMISATTQFEPVTNREQADNSITVNGGYVYMVNVVYAGIDILNISEIDIKTSTYKMDFYLWFRYHAGLDTTGIKPDNFLFINAQSIDDSSLEPISPPVEAGGLTTVTYHVTGTFKNQFSFYEYPFDIQSLPIQFRNENASSSFIQYAVDRLGMQYTSDAGLAQHFKENGAFNDLYGWNEYNAHSEHIAFSTTSTLGNPKNFDGNDTTNYSLINLTVDIRRDSIQYIFKSLLPLFITLVLAYITFFLPIGHSERLAVGSTALLTTAFFHLSLADALPEIGYTVAMEFLFYASYAMSALIVLLETLSIRLEKQGDDLEDEAAKRKIQQGRQNLNKIGRVVYPLILFAAMGAGVLVYNGSLHLGPESEAELKSPVRQFVEKSARKDQAKAEVVTPGAGGKVTLHFSTWRPEDDFQFKIILNAFHEYALKEHNLDITVNYEPVMSTNYDAILNRQLNSGEGPDLFYVRPFSVDGTIVRFLSPLDDLDIAGNYEAGKSAPWQDRDAYYALPFAGVVQGAYYNKEIFARHDIQTPETWDEFLKAAKDLQEKEQGVYPIANTLNGGEDSEMFQSILANFVGGAAGRLDFTTTGGACFTNARIVDAFGAVERLKPYLYLPENPDDRKSNKSKDLFFKEDAAMLFGGSWDVKYFTDKNLPFEWSVFAVPAPGGDPTVIFHPDSGIGINRNGRHPEEARLFLNWLMTDEAVKLMVENLPGFYPLRKDVAGENENIHAQEFLQLASQYPTDARWAETEISDHHPGAQVLIRNALFEIAYGSLTPRQAAKNLQDGLAQWYEPAQTCR